MFSTKCQVQNDRISCFCQNLQFRLYFAIKTSIFKLRPLLSFLCLINSFYRWYVPSMYNRSNRFNRLNRSNRSNRFKNRNRANSTRRAPWFPTWIRYCHISKYIQHIVGLRLRAGPGLAAPPAGIFVDVLCMSLYNL